MVSPPQPLDVAAMNSGRFLIVVVKCICRLPVPHSTAAKALFAVYFLTEPV